MWLFRKKVLQAAFLCLHFRFELFWSKNIGAKAALRLLVTLTPENCYFLFFFVFFLFLFFAVNDGANALFFSVTDDAEMRHF